ncbi:MAG: nucleotide exchange factor GrpE [Candidatus Rokubacteria bacterium]|nr:nucleotide exchange factor GrpE [Candidatus Rokubacteria bacterium]
MDDSSTQEALSPEPEAAPEAPVSEVEELRRQLDEKQDRLLRALAEADNVRRRAQREREEYAKYANESLLRDLIPVLDNLDRALDAARGAVRAAGRSTAEASGEMIESGNAAGVVEGVELIQRELLKVLERAGVTRYSALGEPFDPTRHEAIARTIRADVAPGTVVGEQLPGYLLHGRVLRPALVAVAAAPDEDAP